MVERKKVEDFHDGSLVKNLPRIHPSMPVLGGPTWHGLVSLG